MTVSSDNEFLVKGYQAEKALTINEESHPCLAGLVRALAGDSEADIRRHMHPFEIFISSDEVRSIVHAELKDSVQADGGVNPGRGLVLYRDQCYQLMINFVEFMQDNMSISANDAPVRRTNESTTQRALVGVLAGGSLRMKEYALQDGAVNNVFDSAAKVSLRQDVRIDAGCVGFIDRMTFGELEVVESTQCVVYAVLNEVPALSYRWVYDHDTHQLLYSANAFPIIGRCTVAINALREMSDCGEGGFEASCRLIADLTSSPYYNVRWGAVRALYHLDKVEGIKALESMCNDPQPQVRKAVVGALNALRGAGYV